MRNLLLFGREDRGINRPAVAGIKRKMRARDTRPGVLWQHEAQPEGRDTSPSQPHQISPLKAAAHGFRGGGGIPTPWTGIGTVCPAFHPNCGGMSRRCACSIKAQTGYNLSSRNLIWDTGRIGLVVSHNGVNDGDHLPAGVAHGRHVGFPFISFFLKIKLQRRIVKHRR